jgi:hypothetical protein
MRSSVYIGEYIPIYPFDSGEDILDFLIYLYYLLEALECTLLTSSKGHFQSFHAWLSKVGAALEARAGPP